MITDGFILPDKEVYFDKRFDISECLYALKSFFRNYSVGDVPFDIFLSESCKAENINPRLVLSLLQFGGLLSRKSPPAAWIMSKGVLLPHGEGDFRSRITVLPKTIRELFDSADLEEPVQVKDGAALPKTKLSYVLLRLIPEMGRKEYPDSGLFQFFRFYGQLGRFVKFFNRRRVY